MVTRDLIADRPSWLAVADDLATMWAAHGIEGHLLARRLDTGEELGFDAEVPVPLASVVKVPIALVVLDRIARGELDPARLIDHDPRTGAVGPTGLSAFRHPARVAVGDLVMLMLALSDNASADHLLTLVPPAEIDRTLEEWGHGGIRVRHAMQPLYEAADAAADGDVDLALELAIADERSGTPTITMLDPARANAAGARSLVDLLDAVWADRVAEPAATAELRRLMRLQVFSHRLAADLRSDTVSVAGKTGTFLHLRHEVGVIESVAGERVAIAALTRCARRAAVAADVDLAIGAAARVAFDALRT